MRHLILKLPKESKYIDFIILYIIFIIAIVNYNTNVLWLEIFRHFFFIYILYTHFKTNVLWLKKKMIICF